jgi:hypothetical protein
LQPDSLGTLKNVKKELKNVKKELKFSQKKGTIDVKNRRKAESRSR